MKKHAVTILMLLLCSTAIAADDWTRAFRDTYSTKGIDEAVVNALSEGIAPDLLVKTALSLEDLKPEELIKALYCALVPPAYIREAATANSITDEVVQNGYELALAQCAEEMEERATAAPAILPGKAASPGGRTVNASPSNFE